MTKPTEIDSVDPYGWAEILSTSLAEGYGMVRRLLDDFRAGTNRFDAPGETLLVHLDREVVVGVGGLNLEPDPGIVRAGRVRRLYVLPHHRGKGLARALIEDLIAFASGKHDVLTVNAGRPAVRAFYEHLGFRPVDYPRITHVKDLPGQA